MRQFELHIFQCQSGEMALEISEKDNRPKAIRIWGLPLKVMTETLLNILKKQGYRPTELSVKRKAPFLLNEAPGVRLALLFFALKPMSKPGRMEEIVTGITAMSDEEAYYWYAKCVNGSYAKRSRKSLRVLLAEE
ncbi:MAG: hypothetical protein WCH07_09310 [Deltaproteobacteria bacterium]